MTFLSAAALVPLCSLTTPPQDSRLPEFSSRWLGVAYVGKAIVPFLGDEDPRTLWGFGVQYARPERKFRLWSIPAELVLEGNYTRSSSPGVSGVPANKTNAYGVLAIARYRWPSKNGVGFYFDVGWGLQYADMRTVDLDARLNSTPTLGAGAAIRTGDSEVLVGARFMHISNAGLAGRNQGQNQIMFTAAFRF